MTHDGYFGVGGSAYQGLDCRYVLEQTLMNKRLAQHCTDMHHAHMTTHADVKQGQRCRCA